jgi:hypothetical protein
MITVVIPIAGGKTLEFDGLPALGKHYGVLADAHRRTGQLDKAEVYDIISWQLQNSLVTSL